jgi:cell division initiation protein
MGNDRLTAREIENQEFKRGFRGYEPEEVRLFLRAVAGEVERLHLREGELLEARGRVERELEQLRAREKTLQETLVAAQRMGEEMKRKAREDADLVVREARLQAEQIVREARDRLAGMESEISRGEIECEMVERRLRGVIEQHLAMLDLRREARGRQDKDNVRVMPSRGLGTEAG